MQKTFVTGKVQKIEGIKQRKKDGKEFLPITVRALNLRDSDEPCTFYKAIINNPAVFASLQENVGKDAFVTVCGFPTYKVYQKKDGSHGIDITLVNAEISFSTLDKPQDSADAEQESTAAAE